MEQSYIVKARELREKGYNCAQSVACAFVDILPIDEVTLYKLSEGFGGGMGGNDGTCGALSGAIMVVSLLSSSGDVQNISKEKTYPLVKELYDSFVTITSSPICKELKGSTTGEPLHPCNLCVEDAVRLTYSLIQKI
jgi:C_GCAxxG_C_C family probable redox protein